MIREVITFSTQAIVNFNTTGAICPTSKWAAEGMTEVLNEGSKPRRILEVGPGTGSITTTILEKMGSEDRLVVCEINTALMNSLKKRLSTNPHYFLHKERVSFACCALQELSTDEKFDTIISSLPLLNFHSRTVKELFLKFEELASPQAKLSFYEHCGIRTLSCMVSPRKRRERIKEIDNFLGRTLAEKRIRKKVVVRNITPITVHTLSINS